MKYKEFINNSNQLIRKLFNSINKNIESEFQMNPAKFGIQIHENYDSDNKSAEIILEIVASDFIDEDDYGLCVIVKYIAYIDNKSSSTINSKPNTLSIICGLYRGDGRTIDTYKEIYKIDKNDEILENNISDTLAGIVTFISEQKNKINSLLVSDYFQNAK